MALTKINNSDERKSKENVMKVKCRRKSRQPPAGTQKVIVDDYANRCKMAVFDPKSRNCANDQRKHFLLAISFAAGGSLGRKLPFCILYNCNLSTRETELS